VQLNKNFGRAFTVSATYANQDATSAFDGGSSTASSQFNFHHTKDIFNPEESRSAYETKHRLSLATTFNIASRWSLNHSFGFYYNAQSGRPYSLLFGNDINGDGSGTNDLLYIPTANGIILCPSTGGTPTAASPCGSTSGATPTPIAPLANGEQRWNDFLASAGIEAGTGEILDRYESFEPWTRTLDFHYELGLPPFRDARANITFDMLNALSMFDSEAGVVRYVPNQNFLPVSFSGIDPTTGKAVYREAGAGRTLPGAQFSTADLRSRWQARLGFRVTF
jgi:hypothetical protein